MRGQCTVIVHLVKIPWALFNNKKNVIVKIIVWFLFFTLYGSKKQYKLKFQRGIFTKRGFVTLWGFYVIGKESCSRNI